MVFSSAVFLFGFLPLILLLYYISKNRTYRNIILCLFSFLFYSFGEPIYILLMLFSIIFNYLMAIWFSNSKYKKILFIFTIIINVLLLGYFKYFDFFISIINSIFNSKILYQNISLPIGISFYTFQIMSYIIDVYRGKVKVQRNILKLATYISLFPQLIAGPIVRYETVCEEISNRKETLEDFIIGIQRFIIGLSKKVLIANNMAFIVDTILIDKVGSIGTFLAWSVAICYTLQIYFDFSGYSDMAIGLGRMFGFHFLENFNYPYIAKSITDFWRRWHISLSTWFRDYIYIPMGGNRTSKVKWIRNFLIVWLLTGLWHGASWNFIIWGLYYGIILLLEKTLFKNIIKKFPSFVSHILTLLIIVVGFVIFRITDGLDFLILIKKMFIYEASNLDILKNNFDFLVSLIYIIPGIIFSMPFVYNWFKKFSKKNYITEGISYIVLLSLLLICIASLLSSSYNPFIYFRF